MIRLKNRKLEVDLADEGQVACELAKRSQAEGRPCDLILMDMQMPGLNGFAATGQLRQQGWRGPIVAMTAYAMAGNRCPHQPEGTGRSGMRVKPAIT